MCALYLGKRDASGADELLTFSVAQNLWNKLGNQCIERRHEEQLEQLVQRTGTLVI